MGNDELAIEEKDELQTTVQVTEVNASGHEDKLKRQYSLLSITNAALSIDIAWVVLCVPFVYFTESGADIIHRGRGGSLQIASANGGAPGVRVYSFSQGAAHPRALGNLRTSRRVRLLHFHQRVPRGAS